MTLAQASAASSYQMALTVFAMNFGIVPNAFTDKGIEFVASDRGQADLEPFVNLDGSWENPRRIEGFPAIPNDQATASPFHSDWIHLTEMMNAPVRAITYRLPYRASQMEKNLPKGLIPHDDYKWNEISSVDLLLEDAPSEPDMSGFELLTIRDVLSMLGSGAANVGRVREISDYIYFMAEREERASVAADLFLAAGVLFSGLHENKMAKLSLEKSALRMPDERLHAKAMLYEMSSNAVENVAGRRRAAAYWKRTFSEDQDHASRYLRLFRAMWNAWRGNDIKLVMDVMGIYTVLKLDEKDKMEAARLCVRQALLATYLIGTGYDYRTTGMTLLGIAESLFKRAGDEDLGWMARELADMA